MKKKKEKRDLHLIKKHESRKNKQDDKKEFIGLKKVKTLKPKIYSKKSNLQEIIKCLFVIFGNQLIFLSAYSF